ncbi:hypothetical protein PUMCH_003602 [Australozyma saopauloensis]|uniref:Endoplasmic reticulum transmembrane protein n=1 Tax=Australozyma saopauloensis TaxID=291208 RepID=A0AAX4HCG0_9ASCO|nr:hypothetical protein PUMCH_003602 [[Candida] saopauloensis]
MALYYNLVFVLLVVEMAFFAILSLPFPRKLRKTVLTTVSAPFRSEQFQIALKCIFGFVLVLFIDSVNRVYAVTAELQSISPNNMSPTNVLNDRAEVQSRRFYAQRNMYLCGFTLFLTLILTRTYSLVAELIETKDKLDVLGKEVDTPESSEVTALKQSLKEKDQQLETLKEQAAALSGDYDSATTRRKV